MRRLLQPINLFLICFVLCTNYTFAQPQLGMKSFAIFGGDANASLTDTTISGVEFEKNINVTGGGFIGTETFLYAADSVSVDGDMYGNHFSFNNIFTLSGGSLFIFNKEHTNNFVLSGGSQPVIKSPGNITVNGNTVIGADGLVDGLVTIPFTYTYNGPSPDLGINNATPIFAPLPVMPDTASFPAAGATNITTSQTITPGNYGTMAIGAGMAVTFSGVGTYVFGSIANTGQDTFKYDFQNNSTGTIKIYIIGNADVGNIQAVILNGGDASRIYTEIHGAGNSLNVFTSFLMNTTGTFSGIWQGTVLARNGAIRVGNANPNSVNIINGCMWSSRKVTIGQRTTLNFVPLSSSTDVTPSSSVKPYYIPPAAGKIFTVDGAEITSLAENRILKDSNIYRIAHDSVYIEVIAKQGQVASTLAFLQSEGLTNLISNGAGSLIITGKFPIDNLLTLNTRADIINYARPLFWPLNNSGLVNSQGDSSMRSNLVKNGYNLTGTGVKVGVISDSYNTVEISPGVSGNYAGIDVANGDLPGSPNPVQVVAEYPFGPHIDEGRAMLQIVHDVAPKAQLAFRTGFVSAGDFAQGIGELGAAGCNVIVDDITYLTEPYFRDGVVAQAVDNAVANGIAYFSAAGNFGKNSYEATYSDMLAPASIRGLDERAHNFGPPGTFNPYQTLNLTPGTYTIVLQWDDDIYSLGASTSGTLTDLDMFLVDNTGATLFGFNRNNLGTDPIEVLPFTVETATTANLVIGKGPGSAATNVHFKYIVFRGSLDVTGYSGSSTLVGQANSAGAIAVGAVLYSNTPAYGTNPPTIASFSSVGGTLVNGTDRRKPELTAPNGVNTTVNFNSTYSDGDIFPNFFGTSAAAPHAAAAAALLIEGKKKYLGETITPANLRTLFQTTATDMGSHGYHLESGYGFINPFAAMQTFANPIPKIELLQTASPVTRPVTAPFTVTVKGKGLNAGTQVYVRGAAVTTTFLDNETVTAQIPVFSDNPAIQLFNPSIVNPALSNGNIDGGLSESLYFFSTGQKHIIVKAVDKTKKYGEKLPLFTATITVDGVPIQNTALTPAMLKLDHLTYTTPASSSSNVASYFIQPVNPLNPAIPADALLLAQYSYEFDNGLLTVQKLPLKITPRDTVLTYGKRIRGIKFNYAVGPSASLQNPDSLVSSIRLSHASFIVDSILALENGSGASGRALVNGDLTNMSIMISSGSGASGRALVNNGSGSTEISYLVDVDVTSIFNYLANPASSPLVNGSGASGRALVNTGPLINGTASILVNGSGASGRALVNGNPTLLNSNTTGGTSNTNVAVIVSALDVPAATNTIILTKSVNMVTGGLTKGIHTIVPAAFISANFEITYGLGKLTITPAPLTVTANTKYTDNGVLPAYTSTIKGFQFQDPVSAVSGPVYQLSPAYTGTPGVYTIKPSALSFAGDTNYAKTYVNGVLYVDPYTNGKKIIITLKCVGKVKNNPSGLGYVAHFSAENKNATAIYVPIGTDNNITALGRYSGIQPVLFPKGITCFDLYFDGKKLTWTLKTKDSKVKVTQVAIATSTSCACTASLLAVTYRPADAMEISALPSTIGIFPNPASTKLIVRSDTDFGSEKEISVLDVYGRTLAVKVTIRSAQTIELNVAALPKGTYFIRITQKEKSKTMSFIKL